MNALAKRPLAALLAEHACVADFVASLGLVPPSAPLTFAAWLDSLPDETFFDAGIERGQLIDHIARLIAEISAMENAVPGRLTSLTLIGGHDKSGRPENVELTLRAGEIVCVVGPTGSGKSRLLGDIECLAQGDTPTGRRVLVDGEVPADTLRYQLDRKLVAQLSQNMNFVVDLTVADFIAMHARCRMVEEAEAMAAQVIACANDLTGEKFAPEVSVTQLSGGQTRALMIADAALLSASPVVLIDEIENAGVDRKRALDLLVRGDKIVLISTHDPLLALRGSRRIVIRNGGIAEVLATSERELANLTRIEAVDALVMDIRDRLRRGQRIEEDIAWPQ
jgi:ABC-type lipoprotein export system ATPase subunit